MAVHIVLDAQNMIVNRIEWDGAAEWAPPDGHTVVQGDGEIGWVWDAATQTARDPNPPPAPPPQTDTQII